MFLLLGEAPTGRVEVMTAVDDPATFARDSSAGFNAPAASTVHTPTFGPDGRIYVADSAGARILVYNAAQAFEQAVPTPAATLSSADLLEPMALAFSSDGDLWVADRRNSIIGATVANHLVRFGDVADTTGAQVLAPEATIVLALAGPTSTANTHVNSIQFDPVGRLWYTDLMDWSVGRIDNPHTLVGLVTDYVPQLKFASIDTVENERSSIRNPTSVAFDDAGRLYVGSVGQSTVARYDSPGTLVDGDRQTAASAVIGAQGSALGNSASIGFDQEGALWVASSASVAGATPELVRLGIPGGDVGEVTLTPTARFEWSAAGRTSGGALQFYPPRTVR